jgi:ABC-type Zn uptake system ZnuABC Zn-binding protein ZnuA
MPKRNILITFGILGCVWLFSACNVNQGISQSGDALKVVATTTIVGDVVAQVGGDHIDLSVLLPVGTDPHSFSPNPQDIARVAEADVVFANGAGLEEFLRPLIESAGAEDKLVDLSAGLELLDHPTKPGTVEVEQVADAADHDHEGGDPHTWVDPNNVMLWVQNIETKLSTADAANAAAYHSNAETYQIELHNLDAWIREQIAQIPVQNRKLVTDHTLFGYYADEYGLTQVGALIPGYSTLAEPSAQDLAAMEDAIATLDVRAIFVGNTVNPALSERVAADTGTQLIYVYTGSLSKPGGEAASYLAYMRYNTSAFVEALK